MEIKTKPIRRPQTYHLANAPWNTSSDHPSCSKSRRHENWRQLLPSCSRPPQPLDHRVGRGGDKGRAQPVGNRPKRYRLRYYRRTRMAPARRRAKYFPRQAEQNRLEDCGPRPTHSQQEVIYISDIMYHTAIILNTRSYPHLGRDGIHRIVMTSYFNFPGQDDILAQYSPFLPIYTTYGRTHSLTSTQKVIGPLPLPNCHQICKGRPGRGFSHGITGLLTHVDAHHHELPV